MTPEISAVVDFPGVPSSEVHAILGSPGLDVDAQPAAPDELRRDEVIGRWTLSAKELGFADDFLRVDSS